MKKTIVLGASTNPQRYSFMAVEKLQKYGFEVYPVGIKKGEINGIKILNDFPILNDIHTITIYLNKKNQEQYFDYILSVKPKRVIFNPGTENYEFQQILISKNIQVIENCTLVMLSSELF